ncbi:hypothetical protein IC229_24350 [Spirosoma sp. BT702]|uniref:TMF family protein n=2 Tax=Spirosoma profusum TaxID=2771354 RepID=A0A927ATL2_9BACT|nr:hypothetical protein [Spirosoma profusum]
MQNTMIGHGAGITSTSAASRNTFVGYYAGHDNTYGEENTFMGTNAGESNTSGSQNTIIGFNAGKTNTSGIYNTFMGSHAGTNNTTGGANTFIGLNAGYSNTNGGSNTFIGIYAGTSNTTGDGNTFIGRSSGAQSGTSNFNTGLGYYTGYFLETGENNVMLGAKAGYSTNTGSNNAFLGFEAGYKNTTASNNVFIGYQTGYSNTTGIANLYMGQLAGYSSNGSYNLFIGNSSGQQTTSGGGNTFIGNGSGYSNTTGQNNTYIGNGAGFTGNAAGQSNTFIGQNAGVSSGAVVNNSTAIGVGAQVSANYAIVLGAPNPAWKVGIGNTAPNNKLEITHGTAGQSGLRFTNLKSTDAASLTNQTKVLSVNSSGDVILVSTNGSTREGVSESLWQRKGSFLQSTQNDAIIIGEGVSKTPSDYNLFVSKGILTEKVKVAVKNTSDWSDYVFKSGYSLKPLAEVEQYIRKHEHLPGVPSAEDVVEKGVDVAKMDAKLLEKIEELTLYSIEQQKENQALKDRVVELEKGNQVNQLQQKEIDELKALVKQVLEKK